MGIERQRNGSSKMSYGQVATSTTAAKAISQTTRTRQNVTILNIDAAITIYIGDSLLTTSNGFPLVAGASLTRKFIGDIWAVSASGTPKLAFISDED